MTKKVKKKRAPRRPAGLVDYVLVLEDDGGHQIAMAMQRDSRAPIAGEEVPLQEHVAKEVPHLSGTYVVHRVAHLPPPNAPVTIERYTIPWCYARRPTGDIHASTADHAASLGPVASAEDNIGEAATAELAEKSRAIATELGDMVEEVAAAVHSGAAGTLGLDFVQRLDDASRRAKQVYLTTLAKARIRRESE